MAVRLNSDKETVSTVKEGLKRTGGYCPCRLDRSEETKCMCQEFRDQIKDPNLKDFAIAFCTINQKIKKRSGFSTPFF